MAVTKYKLKKAEEWLRDKEFELEDIPYLLAEYVESAPIKSSNNSVRVEKRIAFSIYYQDLLKNFHEKEMKRIEKRQNVVGLSDEEEMLAGKAKLFLEYSKGTYSKDILNSLYRSSRRIGDHISMLKTLENNEFDEIFTKYKEYKARYEEIKRKLGF